VFADPVVSWLRRPMLAKADCWAQPAAIAGGSGRGARVLSWRYGVFGCGEPTLLSAMERRRLTHIRSDMKLVALFSVRRKPPVPRRAAALVGPMIRNPRTLVWCAAAATLCPCVGSARRACSSSVYRAEAHEKFAGTVAVEHAQCASVAAGSPT